MTQKSKVKIKVNGKSYVHSLFRVDKKFEDGSPMILRRINKPEQLNHEIDPDVEYDVLTGYLQHKGNW